MTDEYNVYDAKSADPSEYSSSVNKTSTESFSSMLTSKPVILILLVGVGWYFSGNFFGKKKDEKSVEPVQVVSTLSDRDMIDIDDLNKLSQSGTEVDRKQDQVIEKQVKSINSLSQSNNELNEKIASLEVTINNLASDIFTLQKSLKVATDGYSNLLFRFEKLNKMVEEKKVKAAKQKEQQMKLARIKNPQKIRALVDGRGWLVSKSGATSTVAIGSEIEGYGKVIGIYPDMGIITHNFWFNYFFQR